MPAAGRSWRATTLPVAESVRRRHHLPGLALAVAVGDAAPGVLFLGADALGRPLGADSLFPVASLTKLATALAVLRLVDMGRLGLDEPLARLLPDAAAAGPGVTVRSLLAHTAGLPERYPDEPALYRPGLTWPAIAAACLRTPAADPPGTRVAYSGVGYALLAIAVERATGRPFPAALTALVAAPLGIEAYLGAEPPRPPARLDVGESLFAGTPLEFYNSPFFRSLGEPDAGLLTTATGALALVRAFAGVPAGFLRPATRAAAIRDQTGGLGGIAGTFARPRCPWGLGPALRGALAGLPATATAASFGHAGASGCLVCHDPGADCSWAILGTRVADNGWCEGSFAALGQAILGAG